MSEIVRPFTGRSSFDRSVPVRAQHCQRTVSVRSLAMVPDRGHGRLVLGGGLMLLGAAAAVWQLVGGGREEVTDLAYVPILLWAFWFGMGGGLVMALASSVAVALVGPSGPHSTDRWYWTALLYLAFGAVGGALSGAVFYRWVAEAELARELDDVHRQLGAVVDASGDAIVSATPEGAIRTWNRAAEKLFGFSAEDILGQPLTVLVPEEGLDEQRQLLEGLRGGDPPQRREVVRRRKDGTRFEALLTASGMTDEAGQVVGLSAIAHDITRRKRLEAQLTRQALYDPLTGLPNRALLRDGLEDSLARSRRRGTNLGLMFVDVDSFKSVNDSMGHSQGDALLRLLARRIQRSIRPGDTVARFGGDEFVVVCEDVAALEMEEIARRVRDAVGQPHQLADREVNVTASLGITLSRPRTTSETLLQEADLAMYSAKQRNAGSIASFDEPMRSKADQRLITSAALHRALDRQEFSVHYQPIIDLSTGKMVGAEALARWEHPLGVVISPDEFIPVAEDTGLIVAIGAWVLEQACREVVVWQDTEPTMSVAVNLSVRQLLAPDLLDTIERVLMSTGIPPTALSLELTESAFLADVDDLKRRMTAIAALGVGLSVDDFGTGYSSLRRLKVLPVDEMKVDRMFVDGLGVDPQDTALVTAIVAMGQALGLQVVAEGVETRAQLEEVKSLGCARAQGFYYARPMPAPDMRALVTESRHWDVG